jgi:hypothetical protein
MTPEQIKNGLKQYYPIIAGAALCAVAAGVAGIACGDKEYKDDKDKKGDKNGEIK